MPEKLQEFLRYLTDRGAPGSIRKTSGLLAFGSLRFFQKKQFVKYERLLNASQYLVLQEANKNYAALVGYLKERGLTFFEGRLPPTERSDPSRTREQSHAGEQSSPGAQPGAGNQFLIGGTDINYTASSYRPKIAALVHVYNEGDILGETIRHLLDQGLHVHIVDNWSTDGSWEIAAAFPETQVSRERFPHEGPSEHYEWFRQLEHSERLAMRLPYDWFLHYDADEFRYSPWPGVSLRDAIGFVERLGYNAIDFTVLDFRYTADQDQVTSGFEANNTWFEFGRRPGHFLQVKGWKAGGEKIDLSNSGGHDAKFPGRRLYPIKFLTKHYSLRSREQAEKKLMADRLPRVQKELNERSWHQHIDLLIAQQAAGWDKKDLIRWTPGSFEKDFLLERISGVGIVG